MKQLLTILTLILCQVTLAQDALRPRITYISPKRDTLIIPDNELGKHIFGAWSNIPKHEQPVIKFASEKEINIRNTKLYSDRKRKVKMKTNTNT